MADSIYDAALESSRWSSMNPERTAKVIAGDFTTHLRGVRAEFHIASPDHDKAEYEYEAYVEGYEKRFRAWLAARGRTASSAVAGASKFPTARNRKALDTERRRSEDLTAWSNRARRQAIKRLTPPRDHAAELAKLEAKLDAMKAVNRIVRRKWTRERKVAAIVADLGFKEVTARKMLEPDFIGRIGFPPYELSSVRGKIKRLRALLQVEASHG